MICTLHLFLFIPEIINNDNKNYIALLNCLQKNTTFFEYAPQSAQCEESVQGIIKQSARSIKKVDDIYQDMLRQPPGMVLCSIEWWVADNDPKEEVEEKKHIALALLEEDIRSAFIVALATVLSKQPSTHWHSLTSYSNLLQQKKDQLQGIDDAFSAGLLEIFRDAKIHGMLHCVTLQTPTQINIDNGTISFTCQGQPDVITKELTERPLLKNLYAQAKHYVDSHAPVNVNNRSYLNQLKFWERDNQAEMTRHKKVIFDQILPLLETLQTGYTDADRQQTVAEALKYIEASLCRLKQHRNRFSLFRQPTGYQLAMQIQQALQTELAMPMATSSSLSRQP